MARQIFYSINESCLSFDVLAGPCGGKWVALCRIAWILESYQHKIQWRLLWWGNVTLLHFRMSSAVWHQRQRIRTVRLNLESNKISIQLKKTQLISVYLFYEKSNKYKAFLLNIFKLQYHFSSCVEIRYKCFFLQLIFW